MGTPYRSQTGRGDASWAMWQMGGAWLASDLYRHYEYTGDRTYLKEVVYPVLRKSVTFLVNTLIESDGIYHSCPSTS
ncbi:glycosyl hydrolase family 95 catalytic domain-containing protein, partial [Enterococcus casseliflavus]|uniref:glycosyl hydrolase family 95 catalytic domain-containing protein n=1 Tax=Enterococcus casseliflavus TaxID=37734 RepID=UPI003D13C91E